MIGAARRHRDDDGADRHDRERHDQPLAAAETVDIGAEINRAERAHQRADPEHHEGGGGVEELRAGMEERLADRRGVDAEQEEVVHLEKIAAGRAQHGADFRLRRGGEGQGGRGSDVQHARLSR
jgi:hypothetical protein